VRVIFSVVGLLLVVAIIGMLAKKQLQAVQPIAGGAASMPAVSVRSTPSSVVNGSLSRARRTTMVRSASVSRSKACSGWPSSSIT